MTLVRLDDLLDNSEPQTGAFLLTRVERGKDFMPFIGWNAAAVINYIYQEVLSLCITSDYNVLTLS